VSPQITFERMRFLLDSVRGFNEAAACRRRSRRAAITGGASNRGFNEAAACRRRSHRLNLQTVLQDFV
jgi:hypothetical protein